MLLKIAIGLACLIIVTNLWIRLTQSDPNEWHQVLVDPAEKAFPAGVIRVVPNAATQFEDFVEIVANTRRTKYLAGSVKEGAVTYITRTLFWGFSDYNTIWIEGDDLVIYARLRFGRGDWGVNGARVSKWLRQFSGT